MIKAIQWTTPIHLMMFNMIYHHYNLIEWNNLFVITPCRVISSFRRLGGRYHLRLQGDSWVQIVILEST